MKSTKRAKPGRGRLGPSDLLETLIDEEEWTYFLQMKAKCTEEDLESLTEYFNNINDVDCDTLGDVLFGDDDPQEFKTAFEGLK